MCGDRSPEMYSGQMAGDAAYESEPEVEDDSYAGDASQQQTAPVAKVNIVPTKGGIRSNGTLPSHTHPVR